MCSSDGTGAGARHLEASGSPSGTMASDDEGQLVGVLIGIDHYEESGTLQALEVAAADARSLHGALAEAHHGRSWLRLLTTKPQPAPPFPTKQNLVESLHEAARRVGPNDTLVLFFAGHGCLLGGDIHLVPTDGRAGRPESLLSLREMVEIFQESPCRQRVLFLDCCQSPAGSSASSAQVVTEKEAEADIRWRSGAPLDGACATALQTRLEGWFILAACCPGEGSHEIPATGVDDDLSEDHGLFSHFLSRGLAGEADLDRDGWVSLAELVQYVGKVVPRRAADVHNRSQHPMVIWQGCGAIPLVKVVGEEREEPEPGSFHRWLRSILGPWTGRKVPKIGFMRYGTGLLFGAVMGLEIGIFGANRPGPGCWLVAAGVGLLTAMVWLAVCALAWIASPQRWHRAGYYGGSLLGLWGLLLVQVPLVWGSAATAGMVQGYLTDLVLLIGLQLFLGLNSVHMIIGLSEIQHRRQERILRGILGRLERHLVDARADSRVPFVSVHPRIYIWVFAVGGTLGVLNLSLAFVVAPLLGHAIQCQALLLARNGLVVLLMLWQVFSFSAAYVHIKHRCSRQI